MRYRRVDNDDENWIIMDGGKNWMMSGNFFNQTVP